MIPLRILLLLLLPACANQAHASGGNETLYISNMGARIVVSKTRIEPSATDQPDRGVVAGLVVGRLHLDAEQNGNISHEEVPAEPLPLAVAAREGAPGCPSVLPEGSDQKSADEYLELYGCQYLSECARISQDQEDSGAVCTWYFSRKVEQSDPADG